MHFFKWIDSYFFLEGDEESAEIRPYFYGFIFIVAILAMYIFIVGK